MALQKSTPTRRTTRGRGAPERDAATPRSDPAGGASSGARMLSRRATHAAPLPLVTFIVLVKKSINPKSSSLCHLVNGYCNSKQAGCTNQVQTRARRQPAAASRAACPQSEALSYSPSERQKTWSSSEESSSTEARGTMPAAPSPSPSPPHAPALAASAPTSEAAAQAHSAPPPRAYSAHGTTHRCAGKAAEQGASSSSQMSSSARAAAAVAG